MPRRLAIAAAVVLLVGACSQIEAFDPTPSPIALTDPLDRSVARRLDYTTRTNADCQAWMVGQFVEFSPVSDQTDGEFCVVEGAVTLGDEFGGAALKLSPSRPMMVCPLGAGIAYWRTQSLEPAARELLGAGVAQIDHLGVYACRRIYGQDAGRPSAHARAAAIDIAGFRLTDGRRINVERDWMKAGPEGQFLRRVRDDACAVFGAVLSPDYNAEHANHLHIEAGRGRLCS